MKNVIHFTILFILASVSSAFAQSNDVQSNETPRPEYPQFKSSVKGFMTLKQFQTFEDVVTTTPYWKRQADLNELSLTGEYYITPKSEIEFEIEFEHGGTGSALEYDPMEEFGEFEKELEKGGEVVLSEFYYRRAFENMMWIKVGKIPVYISLGNVQENLLQYSTIYSVSSEASLIAHEWREMGIELQKRFGGFNARTSLLTGLNSEFFRKYNWVGGGYQRQFENINANSLAGTLTFEYGDVSLDDGIATTIYYNEVSGNRYKQRKMSSDASITLFSIFGSWHFERFGVRGEFIQGTLTRSDQISLANASLTSSVNPGAFAPLGHTAQLEMGEIFYYMIDDDEARLTAFFNYQHVDSMKTVEGSILKDDRYNRVISTFGLMKTWEKIMFVKAEYAKSSNALVGFPETSEFQLAFGFDWRGFYL